MDERNQRTIRLVRAARGLEAGGFYNASKLLWALAYAEEIRLSGEPGVPMPAEELDRELEAIASELAAEGMAPDLVTALQRGRQAAQENRAIPWTDIPSVFVCRSCGLVALRQAPGRCPSCGAWGLTFREFPPIYFLEPLSPGQALAALTAAPDEVEAEIRGLSEEQMGQVPRPGEWAVRDLLAHLLVAQGLLAGRVERMLSEENTSIDGVAAWTFGEHRVLAAHEILRRYHVSRLGTVELLKKASPQQWQRTAWHTEFGHVTVLQQASYFAKHERSHLPQISAIRRAIGADGA